MKQDKHRTIKDLTEEIKKHMAFGTLTWRWDSDLGVYEITYRHKRMCVGYQIARVQLKLCKMPLDVLAEEIVQVFSHEIDKLIQGGRC